MDLDLDHYTTAELFALFELEPYARDLERLKVARRKVLLHSHPDKSGDASGDLFRFYQAAMERVKDFYTEVEDRAAAGLPPPPCPGAAAAGGAGVAPAPAPAPPRGPAAPADAMEICAGAARYWFEDAFDALDDGALTADRFFDQHAHAGPVHTADLPGFRQDLLDTFARLQAHAPAAPDLLHETQDVAWAAYDGPRGADCALDMDRVEALLRAQRGAGCGALVAADHRFHEPAPALWRRAPARVGTSYFRAVDREMERQAGPAARVPPNRDFGLFEQPRYCDLRRAYGAQAAERLAHRPLDAPAPPLSASAPAQLRLGAGNAPLDALVARAAPPSAPALGPQLSAQHAQDLEAHLRWRDDDLSRSLNDPLARRAAHDAALHDRARADALRAHRAHLQDKYTRVMGAQSAQFAQRYVRAQIDQGNP